jgi:mitochondrial fusion and transport protein UGO1
MAKQLMDKALWSYTAVFFAQPFEVAKTILQVHLADSQAIAAASRNGEARSRPNSYASGKFEDVGPISRSLNSCSDRGTTVPIRRGV